MAYLRPVLHPCSEKDIGHLDVAGDLGAQFERWQERAGKRVIEAQEWI